MHMSKTPHYRELVASADGTPDWPQLDSGALHAAALEHYRGQAAQGYQPDISFLAGARYAEAAMRRVIDGMRQDVAAAEDRQANAERAAEAQIRRREEIERLVVDPLAREAALRPTTLIVPLMPPASDDEIEKEVEVIDHRGDITYAMHEAWRMCERRWAEAAERLRATAGEDR